MTSIGAKAYLAGYNGGPMPRWVSRSTPGLYKAYKQGVEDRKSGKPLIYKRHTNKKEE